MSTLNELFRQLEVHSANSEHAEVHEQAYEILKSAPHDLRALRLTVVALINMDRYLEALRVLKQYGAQADPQNSLELEKLYVLYKLDRSQELHTALKESSSTKGVLHIKAQFLYREGHYPEAWKLYQQLVETTDSADPELADLEINQRAVLADGVAAGALSSTQTATHSSTATDTDSYDLLFNESAIALAKNDHQQALELLSKAEQLCRAANPDADDQREEVTPILLQRAYILASLGQADEAGAILSTLESEQLDDELASTVLSNNVVSSTSSSTSPVFLLKELGFPNKLNQVSPRLSAQQRCILWKNYYRLATRAGKRVQSGANSDVTAQVLSSISKAGVSLTDEDDLKAQAKKALKFASTSVSIPASLASAQLNINAGNLDAAVASLELLPEESRLTPGICGALLSLYDTLGSEKKSTALFQTVTSAYESKDLTEQDHAFLSAFALHFLNRANTSAQAKQLLTTLNQASPSPLIDAALDPTSSATHLPTITPTHSVDQLVEEATNRIQSQTSTKIHTSKIVKKRTRKQRHLPQTYDESKQPDAERWLPMKDRSYYKPKKGKKGKSKDTQGGVADHITEEALNVNNASTSSAGQKKKKKGKK